MTSQAELILLLIIEIAQVSEETSQLISAAAGRVVVAARTRLAIIAEADLVTVLGFCI